MITQQIAKRLKYLRNKQQLSQESLSFKSDLSRSYICDIENERRNITVVNLYKICKGLNISIQQFFNDEIFNNVK